MKITADTNIILRTLVLDDQAQAKRANEFLKNAEIVIISLQTLCELVWVLQKSYDVSRNDIKEILEMLLNTQNVIINRPAAEAGLSAFKAGADFADGIIAYEGSWLGSECFVSFDKKAVSALKKAGQTAQIL